MHQTEAGLILARMVEAAAALSLGAAGGGKQKQRDEEPLSELAHPPKVTRLQHEGKCRMGI